MFNGIVMLTARADGDATRVQMPRNVGVLYGEDVLDAVAELPLRGRRVKGPLRRCLASHDAQYRSGESGTAERRGSSQDTTQRSI